MVCAHFYILLAEEYKIEFKNVYGENPPPLRKELAIYQAICGNQPDLSVLQFWSDNKKTLPIIASLARKFLCVPVTTGPVESLFSVAGAILSDHKTRMKDDLLNALLLLKYARLSRAQDGNEQ